MWGWHWFNSGMGWGWTVFGWAMMALFWGAVIWLFAGLVQGRGGDRSHSRVEDPSEIAAKRFAAGEITEEEYERILHRLHRSGGMHYRRPATSDEPYHGTRRAE